MIAYQIGNGKTIYLTFDQWLNLTDEKLSEYIAKDAGFEADNPFYDLTCSERKPSRGDRNSYDLPPVEGIEPIDEEIIEEIKKQIDEDNNGS